METGKVVYLVSDLDHENPMTVDDIDGEIIRCVWFNKEGELKCKDFYQDCVEEKL